MSKQVEWVSERACVRACVCVRTHACVRKPVYACVCTHVFIWCGSSNVCCHVSGGQYTWQNGQPRHITLELPEQTGTNDAYIIRTELLPILNQSVAIPSCYLQLSGSLLSPSKPSSLGVVETTELSIHLSHSLCSDFHSKPMKTKRRK